MSRDLIAPRRALLSVADKTGLPELARALHERGVELVSTGGTARFLADLGLPVREVSALTGFPEILDGRVKTLHPKIHGGLLAREEGDEAVLKALGIEPIDLVVVNLYPFERCVERLDVVEGEAIEQIDIGGPALLRAAAKNFVRVAVLCDPGQYPPCCRASRKQAAPRWRFAAVWRQALSAALRPTMRQSPPGSAREWVSFGPSAWSLPSSGKGFCVMARTRTSRERSIARRGEKTVWQG